jgi:hypothetical protein
MSKPSTTPEGQPLQVTADDFEQQERAMKPQQLQHPPQGSFNGLGVPRPDRFQRVPQPDYLNPFQGQKAVR